MLRKREDGFTMLEILIVVTIIGALMGILANRFLGRKTDADISICTTQMRQLEQAFEMYRLDNGNYPSTEQGAAALVEEPTSDPAPRRYPPGGYVKRDFVDDPWGNRFVYTFPGEHNAHSFDLYSMGPDGADGGEGQNADIVNWDTGTFN